MSSVRSTHPVGVGLVAILGIALSACAQAAEMEPRHIQVSGSAQQMVAPDQAQIHLQLEGRGKDAGAAMRQVGERTQRLLQTLEALVSQERIRALQTDVREVVEGTTRSWVRERGEPLEFLALRGVQIERLPLSQLPALMEALAKSPLARIDGVQTSYSQARQAEDALQLEALDDAKARAQRLAERAGVRLGLPLSISVHSRYEPQPKMMRAEAYMVAADSSMAGGGYDAAGQERIEARVDVRYELLPLKP
ncbi:MAG: SIMPL domain-containing protein [Oceanococcaceae bacterium]